MKKYLFIILSFLFFANPVRAATYNYYFSDDATGNAAGSDTTGDGTIGTPWKSLSKAQTEVDNAGSSDTVNLYFDRTDTWTVDTICGGSTPCTTLVWCLDIGSDDPIVNIDAYGAGAKPIFDGSVSDFTDGGVPSSGGADGPYFWSNMIKFDRNNCSISNIDIKNCYGSAIQLGDAGNGADYSTIEACDLHNTGYYGVMGSTNYGTQNSTITKNLLHNIGQLYLVGKGTAYNWGVAITLSPWNGTNRAPANNEVSYNVLYDISGEGIHGAGGTLKYNIVGDTGSYAIFCFGTQSDMPSTTICYNLITMSDFDNSAYDDLSSINPSGIVVADDILSGGDNTSAIIQIYGNTIINRYHGIVIDDYADESYLAEVRIFNNAVFDSHNKNYYINDCNSVAPGKGFIYNNASILYDQTGSTHCYDSSGSGTFGDYWTVSHHAFWTTGGDPTVDADWQTSAVVTDPKITGEDDGPIDWDGQAVGDPRSTNLTFANLTPKTGSHLIDAGKSLLWEKTFLGVGTDYNVLPSTQTFIEVEEDWDSIWDIGPIIPDSELSAPVVTDNSTSPVTCPYCSGCDAVDVIISCSTDINAYMRISTSDQTWDQMTSSKAFDSGDGTTTHTHTLSSQDCDSTVTVYVAASTQAGDEGIESSTDQIDITVNAESDYNPPPPTGFYSSATGGALGIAIHSDTSGALDLTVH